MNNDCKCSPRHQFIRSLALTSALVAALLSGCVTATQPAKDRAGATADVPIGSNHHKAETPLPATQISLLALVIKAAPDDGLLRVLAQDWEVVESKLMEQGSDLGDDHPDVRRTRNMLIDLGRKISGRVDARIDILQARRKAQTKAVPVKFQDQRFKDLDREQCEQLKKLRDVLSTRLGQAILARMS